MNFEIINFNGRGKYDTRSPKYSIRKAKVVGYDSDIGFKIIYLHNKEHKSGVIPKSMLTLTGSKLYSLPNNTKHKPFTEYTSSPDTKYQKPNVVLQQWSNLKIDLKITIYLDLNDNIKRYDTNIN